MRTAILTLVLVCSSSNVTPSFPEPSTPADKREQADSLDGPPFVSAKGWAVADAKTGKLLWSHNPDQSRAMASTTKIMTAHLVLRLAAKTPSVLDEVVTFSEKADKTNGSSAKLKAGEKLPVRDLLYGLLLPSGNDASVALAEHFGHMFQPKGAVEKEPDAEESLDLFVAEMNRIAEQLGMTSTKYFDPHGLGKNQSSPSDLLRLTWSAMQDPTFREYVNTRTHRCKVSTDDEKTRDVVWKNTNRLLGIDGYDGVKTGTTRAAGACLVSSGHRGDDHLLIVVLGSTSSDGRYVDTRNLFRWAWKQRGHGKPAKP